MPKTILITGASGHIGSHLVAQALSEGHRVVAMVRDPHDRERYGHLLALPDATERLQFKGLDLMADQPFTAHIEADWVAHLGWPAMPDGRNGAKALSDRAYTIMLDLLRAAASSSQVSRVVIVSSLSAMAEQPGQSMLLDDRWNLKPGADPLVVAKVRSEKAAWDFMEANNPGFVLVSINPAPITGPVHDGRLTPGNRLLADLVNGVYPVMQPIIFPLVDVRDVARSIMAALSEPGAQGRYLCAGVAISMSDLAGIVAKRGYKTARLPKQSVGAAIAHALSNPARLLRPRRPAIGWHSVPDREPPLSTARLRGDLGIWFRHQEDMVADALADLAAKGHIPPPAPKEEDKKFEWEEQLVG